jgi:hypothetical protein|tara:strand:+ start:9299 stop:9625 length:327 start_codon:yes stop_codon:yes gene_type:complete
MQKYNYPVDVPPARIQATEPQRWLVNPHGLVVSCSESVFNWRLGQPGYRQAREDEIPDVPKEKQYPMVGELTELGRKRRSSTRVNRKKAVDEPAKKAGRPKKEVVDEE